MAEDFHPENASVKNGNFFGMPYAAEDAEVAILSIPWDVTTSYRDGTSRGPRAMLEASYQLDFFSPYRSEAWKTRIATLPTPPSWFERSLALRARAKVVIHALESGKEPDAAALAQVNHEGAAFHAETESAALAQLKAGRRLLTLGGDHSVSLGPIRALAGLRKFSVLHIDAHADLRVAYEGFEHSHASIMHHVKELPAVEKLVQVGLRDVSPSEHAEITRHPKITAHFDWDLRRRTAAGESWAEQCRRIVEPLGAEVYVSVDIDGLDPRYCPSTGTPVPGGLEYWELFALFEEVERSGRRFVGADLVEVAPGGAPTSVAPGGAPTSVAPGGAPTSVAPGAADEWDANVGARILFQLCQFLREKK